MFNIFILLIIFKFACIDHSQSVGTAYEIQFARCCDKVIRGRVINRIISLYYLTLRDYLARIITERLKGARFVQLRAR